MNLNQLTIQQIHQGLIEKKFSSSELTQAVFKQINQQEQKLHAYLNLTENLALEQAKNIDDKISQGEEISNLAGVPVAIKDNILVLDQPCTAGSRILENYVAPYDATVVKLLKKAGAVIVGKTNMDEFAMGSSTENSAFGPTKNPNNINCVPGGSSGGSTAAVKADECIYALGSDTGGSIRQPASFCGVVGLKPTYGSVSRYGLMAMASSLDQIGPLTKTVLDAQLVFKTISGQDRHDSTSLNYDFKVKEAGLRDLKIGIPKEYFIEGLDEQVAEKIKTAIGFYEKQGAKIVDISLPHTSYALACYYIIMPAEVSANLARYDGIKYGLSIKADKLLDVYLKSRQQGLGDEVRRRIMLGTYTLSAGYYDAYYLKAQKVRTLIKQDFQKAFEQVSVIMTPVTPTPAFALGEKIDDPLKMYLSDIYTISVNLAGLPAVSVPCGQVSALPVGLQIIGNYFTEDQILSIAQSYESLSG